LLPAHQWAKNFKIETDDVDELVNILMERETPMTHQELALILVEKYLEKQKADFVERYQGAAIYQPSGGYEVGQRLVFPQYEFETAHVVAVREGISEDYGKFSVIAVEFDDVLLNTQDKPREFAANFVQEHPLNAVQEDADANLGNIDSIRAEDILEASRETILSQLKTALEANEVLLAIAGYWFPGELVIEVDIGHLHLAEAVLDMAAGGPLTTEAILEQIGGLGDVPQILQVFSMNVALDEDKRFDEVGAAGEVMWYLNRLEPEMVNRVPAVLQYDPIPYDPSLLTDEMVQLERELKDELSDIPLKQRVDVATVLLLYPHRRVGTLPLNVETRQIFPTARTPRICIQLVDELDGEMYTAWVVHEHHYIYGLEAYYNKHHLPIGAFVQVRRGETAGQYSLSHDAHRAHTEWIRLFTPQDDQMNFDTKKRSIGAGFDDLVIVGVDDLEAVDTFVSRHRQLNIAALIRRCLQGLSRLTPQGTVHAKTLYSVINIVRRCPPGPLFATLVANPDFEDVGGHYWKLSSS